MVEKESSPQNPLDIAREIVFREKGDWAFHIEYDHHGYPASTCHRCLNHRQVILLAEEQYNELLKMAQAQNEDSNSALDTI